MDVIHPHTEYKEHLRQGRFMLPRGRSSGRYFFYPRVAAPQTGEDLEWAEASGRGTVYAVTIVRPKPPKEPYSVVLVDLAEGPRMMSRVETIPPEQVAIGMKVKARIKEEGGAPLLVFDPVDPHE